MPVIYGIHPHKTSTEQKHPLGSLGLMNDGRAYRYCQNAGSSGLNPGQLSVAPDVTANHEDRDVNSFLVGDRSITIAIGATAITGNEYQEGFVNITDETGQGIMYKIKNIPTSSGSETITVDLEEPIRVTAVAATTATLYRNKYRDVVISDGTLTDVPVGVPNVTISTDDYGWLQVGGPCSVLNDASTTVVAGQPVTIGQATNGAVEVIAAATEPTVGICPAGAVGATGEYVVVELTIN